MEYQAGTFEAIRTADVSELLKQYQGLLRSVAKRYQGKVKFEEAYQEACAAFLAAVMTYDETRGPFPAYAAAKVRGDVRTAMRRLWTWQDRTAYVGASREDDEDAEALDKLQSIAAHSRQDLEPDSIQRFMLRELIAAGRLSTRERLWLDGFLAGLSREEIAMLYHVSGETVKTWRKRVLQKLRNAAYQLGYTSEDIH